MSARFVATTQQPRQCRSPLRLKHPMPSYERTPYLEVATHTDLPILSPLRLLRATLVYFAFFAFISIDLTWLVACANHRLASNLHLLKTSEYQTHTFHRLRHCHMVAQLPSTRVQWKAAPRNSGRGAEQTS